MGRIVISTNMSLDGIVQDPDGREGFRHGGWFARSGGPDLEPWAGIMSAEAERTAALLLGRRSDAWFAERWSARTDPWAERLNALPKYVMSESEPQPNDVRSSRAEVMTIVESSRSASTKPPE